MEERNLEKHCDSAKLLTSLTKKQSHIILTKTCSCILARRISLNAGWSDNAINKPIFKSLLCTEALHPAQVFGYLSRCINISFQAKKA